MDFPEANQFASCKRPSGSTISPDRHTTVNKEELTDPLKLLDIDLAQRMKTPFMTQQVRLRAQEENNAGSSENILKVEFFFVCHNLYM